MNSLFKRTKHLFIKFLIGLLIILLLPACAAAEPTAEIDAPSQSFLPQATPTLTPEPTPTPQPTPEPDPIETLISQMSDSELIGQMVMMGFSGTKDVDEKSAELIQKYRVGNIILFGWNTRTFDQTTDLIEKINACNTGRVPLTIAIDLEGGSVRRFRGWKPRLKSALNLGRTKDPQQAYDQYKYIGETLTDMGITLNLAPVLDISKDPESTFIGSRMFGGDPEKVSAMARAAIAGLHDSGITCMGKHFPGHGETTEDSHNTLPVIKTSMEQLESYALVPFMAAIEQGADAMLIGHLSFPKIDDAHISSLSHTLITSVLREQLGFDGVICSDDLRMRALRTQCSVGEGAVRHILAGGDMVMIGKNADLQTEVFEALHGAAADGTLSRERLEQSVRRILKMKFKYAKY